MEKQNKYGIKVGDVFHSTWGYNMIGHNFYKVMALCGQSSVLVCELDTRNTSDDGYGQRGYLKMCYDSVSTHPNAKSIKRLVKLCGTKPYIKISNYETAYLLDPKEYDEEFYFDYLD